MGILQDWGKKASDWAKERGGQLAEGWKHAGGEISKSWKRLPPEWKIIIVVTAMAVGFWFLAPVLGAAFVFSVSVGSVTVLTVTTTTAAVTIEVLGIAFAVYTAQQTSENKLKDGDQEHKSTGDQSKGDTRSQQDTPIPSDGRGSPESTKGQTLAQPSQDKQSPAAEANAPASGSARSTAPDPDDGGILPHVVDPASLEEPPAQRPLAGINLSTSTSSEASLGPRSAGAYRATNTIETGVGERIPLEQPYYSTQGYSRLTDQQAAGSGKDEDTKSNKTRVEKDMQGRDQSDPKSWVGGWAPTKGSEAGGLSVSIFGGSTSSQLPVFQGKQPLGPQVYRSTPQVELPDTKMVFPSSIGTPAIRIERLESAESVRQQAPQLQMRVAGTYVGRRWQPIPEQESSFGTMDAVHLALGIGSLVPGYGIGFAVADAALYAIEGNPTAVAMAAMGPFVGSIGKLGKLTEELIPLLCQIEYAEIKGARSFVSAVEQLVGRGLPSGSVSGVLVYNDELILGANIWRETSQEAKLLYAGEIGRLNPSITEAAGRPLSAMRGNVLEQRIIDLFEKELGVAYERGASNAPGIDLLRKGAGPLGR
jgi:hypothetical protein